VQLHSLAKFTDVSEEHTLSILWEDVDFSEMSVHIYWTIWCHITDDVTLQNHCIWAQIKLLPTETRALAAFLRFGRNSLTKFTIMNINWPWYTARLRLGWRTIPWMWARFWPANKQLISNLKWENGYIQLHILDLSTSWRWGVSFMPW
jgi:hypothetical protein